MTDPNATCPEGYGDNMSAPVAPKYNAKAVYFTVAGVEIHCVVFNRCYTLLLEALLKKVFHTVRVVDVEWPDANALYNKGYAAGMADAAKNEPTFIDVPSPYTGVAKPTSVWYKAISKDRSVVACKAMVDGEIRTVIHKAPAGVSEAHDRSETIKKKGKIDLQYWF